MSAVTLFKSISKSTFSRHITLQATGMARVVVLAVSLAALVASTAATYLFERDPALHEARQADDDFDPGIFFTRENLKFTIKAVYNGDDKVIRKEKLLIETPFYCFLKKNSQHKWGFEATDWVCRGPRLRT